jgi:hypothetical protein
MMVYKDISEKRDHLVLHKNIKTYTFNIIDNTINDRYTIL